MLAAASSVVRASSPVPCVYGRSDLNVVVCAVEQLALRLPLMSRLRVPCPYLLLAPPLSCAGDDDEW